MRLVLSSNNEMGFCEFTNIPKSVNPIKDREKGKSLEKYLIHDTDQIWGCWDMDFKQNDVEELSHLATIIPYSETVLKGFSNKSRCMLKNKLGSWGVKGFMVSQMMKTYPKTISEVK